MAGQDICARFHRVNPVTAQRCLKSDTVLAGQLSKGESYNIYKCENGLVDVALPIIIGGEHVANLFTGQFFLEEPDKAFFLHQVEMFGFDRESYLHALSKTPIFAEGKVREIMDFLTRLAHLIGDMGLAHNKLLESEARFRLLINQAPDAILVYDVDLDRLVDCNLAAEKLFGFCRNELLATCLENLYLPDQLNEKSARQAIFEAFERTLGGEEVLFEQTIRNSLGKKLVCEVRLVHLPMANSRLVRCSYMDISERKRYETKLQLAANVFTYAHEGIIITDANGEIVDVNGAFTSITGYPREEVIGQNPRILKSGQHGPEFYDALWHDLTTKGHWYGEIWNRRKNGDVYAEMISISAILNSNGQAQNYVALFSDITLEKQHQRQLEHIAHYDALTGLPNRLLLSDRLDQVIARTQRHNSVVLR